MTAGLRRRTPSGAALDAAALVEWLGADAGVRANMVASADGRATVDGRVGPLTSEADQALLTGLRGWCDVLLVGAGTVRAEGYGVIDLPEALGPIRAARGQAQRPVLAILSRTLDLDPALPAFAGARPEARPWVITGAGADRTALEPHARIVEVPLDEGGHPSLAAALGALRAAGLTRILSEGGPTTLGTLLGQGLVDELFLTVAPLVVGGAGPRIVHAPEYGRPLDLRLRDVLGADGEVFLRYEVLHPTPGAGWSA